MSESVFCMESRTTFVRAWVGRVGGVGNRARRRLCKLHCADVMGRYTTGISHGSKAKKGNSDKMQRVELLTRLLFGLGHKASSVSLNTDTH